MAERIHPPWTPAQVQALNAYQRLGVMHPFTCAHRDSPVQIHIDHGEGDQGVLVATSSGWVCRDCAYRQDWAHAWMADPEWERRYLSGQLVEPRDPQTVEKAHDWRDEDMGG